MLTTPPKRALPQTVDARKLTGQGVHLTGVFTGEQLPRLAAAVLNIDEPVDVELSFNIDEQGTRTVVGTVSAKVAVTCQRCMEGMPLELRSDVALGLVWDEEGAKHLSSELEPWIVADESAQLSRLVEDELLLALPFVNYHDEGDCQGISHFSTGEVEESSEPNPFQVLEQLKQKD